MRYLTCVLTLVLAALAAEQTDTKPRTDFQAASHLFDYDAKQPLEIHDKVIEEFNGGTLHDVTYVSPKGGPVGAYLVVPNGKGPFAAVLFGHWGNGTRAEFIPEAKLYARAGAVSLIPDYPWDRRQPWHKTPDHFDKPELDREIEIQAVVDLRRGIDLLLARPDVDVKRLAYVGHSYGAPRRAKIPGSIGWHTLRHSYRAWLDDSGAPLGVQQKLMRHANISTTMNVYGGAFMEAKRKANTSVVQRVLAPNQSK